MPCLLGRRRRLSSAGVASSTGWSLDGRRVLGVAAGAGAAARPTGRRRRWKRRRRPRLVLRTALPSERPAACPRPRRAGPTGPARPGVRLGGRGAAAGSATAAAAGVRRARPRGRVRTRRRGCRCRPASRSGFVPRVGFGSASPARPRCRPASIQPARPSGSVSGSVAAAAAAAVAGGGAARLVPRVGFGLGLSRGNSLTAGRDRRGCGRFVPGVGFGLGLGRGSAVAATAVLRGSSQGRPLVRPRPGHSPRRSPRQRVAAAPGAVTSGARAAGIPAAASGSATEPSGLPATHRGQQHLRDVDDLDRLAPRPRPASR